jgi:cytochrome c-type biogenesis protein CcmH
VTRKTVLAAAILAAVAALAVVALRGPSEPRTLQDRVRAIASGLRCPVCQNLSVADSPSGLAREMRATIGRDLQAGKSPDQVRQGFVEAYGEWILLSPSRRGINLVAWILPAILFLAGVVAAGLTVRRWTAGRTGSAKAASTGSGGHAPALSPADRRLLERALSRSGEEPE